MQNDDFGLAVLVALGVTVAAAAVGAQPRTAEQVRHERLLSQLAAAKREIELEKQLEDLRLEHREKVLVAELAAIRRRRW